MMPAQSMPMRLSLHELLDGLVAMQEPGVLANVTPTGLCLDSREVKPGQVFIALTGSNSDGSRFIDQAIAMGAVAVIADTAFVQETLKLAREKKIPLIHDGLLREKLSDISSRFYGEPSEAMRVIGVTGTDGKTSLSHFIAQALDQPLSAPEQHCGLIGTLGFGVFGELKESGHTTPDAIGMQKMLAQLLDLSVHHVVMEASSHGLDQGRVNAVRFDMVMLTNLGRDHLDYHGDLDAYKQAKAKLFAFPGIKYAVLNGDDDFSYELLEKHGKTYAVSLFGLVSAGDRIQKSGAADWVLGDQIQWHKDGFLMEVLTPNSQFTVNCPLYGTFNVDNVLALIAALRCFGWKQQEIVDAVGDLQSVNGRMQLHQFDHAATVVIDYAHTPQALKAALLSLQQHCSGRLWCVFGCGGDRDNGKRSEMGAIAEAFADCVIVTDDNPRFEQPSLIVADILKGVKDHSRVMVQHDRVKAIQLALSNAKPSDIVLIAGKGHEEYQLVAGDRIPFSDLHVVETLMRTQS